MHRLPSYMIQVILLCLLFFVLTTISIFNKTFKPIKYELFIGKASNKDFDPREADNIDDISYKTTFKERRDANWTQNHPKDENCLPLHFSNTKLPRTALASFPGSGNTWTRHLLQQATGKVIPRYDRVILLVRNIYDALHADFNRRYGPQHNHTSVATEDLYKKEFPIFVRKRIKVCVRYFHGWLTVHKAPLLVVRYEDLLLDLKRELTKMLNFLEFPKSEETLECVTRNAEGNFHRKSDSFNPFIGMDNKLLNNLAIIEDAIHKAVIYRTNTPLILLNKNLSTFS